jgi:hypothetical protein
MKLLLIIVAVCLTALLALNGPAWTKIGVVTEVQAYLYGYPLVLMDVTRQVGTQPNAPGPHGPPNQFVNIWTFPDPTFTLVVSPNADTPRPSPTFSRNPLSCTCRTPRAVIT